jgi:beta-1,4-mannooligosaccharide/beta-1,4-mannosyl-N-acetylglucosamine phosphorylase
MQKVLMTSRILRKHPENPIIKPEDIPGGAAMYVLNPGAIKFRGEYLILLDVATLAQSIILWLARSRDGVHFTPDPEPVKWPVPDPIHPEGCIYDPRITQIGEDYFILYASSNEIGVRVGIVKTRDFQTFERVSIASELGNRNACLFPEKINGLYCRLDRPFGDPGAPCDIWISYSPDLVFWGRSQRVMANRPAFWDDHKIGGGAVPIKTDKGWLIIYHGTTSTGAGFIYRLGVAMLDLKDPSKVLARGEDAVLWPEHPYEMTGRVGNVVFTCNAIVEPDETVKIYYGAADTCIGLAEGKLSDLVDACYRPNPYILRPAKVS